MTQPRPAAHLPFLPYCQILNHFDDDDDDAGSTYAPLPETCGVFGVVVAGLCCGFFLSRSLGPTLVMQREAFVVVRVLLQPWIWKMILVAGKKTKNKLDNQGNRLRWLHLVASLAGSCEICVCVFEFVPTGPVCKWPPTAARCVIFCCDTLLCIFLVNGGKCVFCACAKEVLSVTLRVKECLSDYNSEGVFLAVLWPLATRGPYG